MISWNPYWNRVVSLHIQFDLARKAILGFGETPEATERYLQGEVEEIQRMLRDATKRDGIDVSGIWLFTAEGVEKFREAVRATLPSQLREVEKRLRQNEVVLRVAIFEAFMKDLHREVLRQKPSLLRSDRIVHVGRVVAIGWDKVLEEEIESEVQTVDRKSPAHQARYFRDRLGIDWFGGTIVPFLKHVIETRNAVLHEDPDRDIDDSTMGMTSMVCFAIPWVSFAQATVLYPDGFERMRGTTEAEIRKFLLGPKDRLGKT